MITLLTLHDFRNYALREFEFTHSTVVFHGHNGAGKTNILEAISVMSSGRSWRERNGSDLIRDGEASAKVVLETRNDNTSDTFETLITPRSRTFRRNDKAIKRTDFVGQVPTLLFVPEHLGLFSAGKRERQAFFDRFLCQTDPAYRTHLSEAGKAVRQRNALLRSEDCVAGDLKPWEAILAQHLPPVRQARRDFLDQLNPQLQKELDILSGSNDPIRADLVLSDEEREAGEDLISLFDTLRPREIAARKSLVGPHRDDFAFFLRERPIMTTASRGETRSVLLALLAAKRILMTEKLQKTPILLLDDVFSELDDDRQAHLEALCESSQVFCTTTHVEHFKRFSNVVQTIMIS